MLPFKVQPLPDNLNSSFQRIYWLIRIASSRTLRAIFHRRRIVLKIVIKFVRVFYHFIVKHEKKILFYQWLQFTLVIFILGFLLTSGEVSLYRQPPAKPV
jgi:hypothetical protein